MQRFFNRILLVGLIIVGSHAFAGSQFNLHVNNQLNKSLKNGLEHDFHFIVDKCIEDYGPFGDSIPSGQDAYTLLSKVDGTCGNATRKLYINFSNGQKLTFNHVYGMSRLTTGFLLHNTVDRTTDNYCLEIDRKADHTYLTILPAKQGIDRCRSDFEIIGPEFPRAYFRFTIDNQFTDHYPLFDMQVLGRTPDIVSIGNKGKIYRSTMGGLQYVDLGTTGIKHGQDNYVIILGKYKGKTETELRFKFLNGQTVTFLYPTVPQRAQIIIDSIDKPHGFNEYCLTTGSAEFPQHIIIKPHPRSGSGVCLGSDN